MPDVAPGDGGYQETEQRLMVVLRMPTVPVDAHRLLHDLVCDVTAPILHRDGTGTIYRWEKRRGFLWRRE